MHEKLLDLVRVGGAESGADVAWSSDSLPIEGGRAQLREGRHAITARAGNDGRSMTTWIDVKAL